MVQKLNQIPAEQRWDIATRCADIMPFAYDQAFRKVAPEQLRELDQAEREIWREMGRKQGAIAKNLGYSTNSALEVAEAFSEISAIMLGPHLRGRAVSEGGNSATVITDECPMPANAKRFGIETKHACELCNAYVTAATESLNPNYRLRSDRHICMGDSSCRMTIEKIQR
ncbi:hypothetical protein [Methanogenium cariaci]|jgi:hypothetical protein